MLVFIVAALVFVSAPDGHTLTVRDGNVKTVLRLAEVDAPERTQPYSQISRRNLTGHTEPTTDAGYTTAGLLQLPQLSINSLAFGRSPYRKG